MRRERDTGSIVQRHGVLTRRRLLQSALAAGGVLGARTISPAISFARGRQSGDRASAAAPPVALTLARFLNRTTFDDLPPLAIEHGKMIVASTLASAAFGTRMSSATIVRELAKEQGGRPDAPIWFDGTKLPLTDVARVNAMLSDAAASDDSDLRNVAHIGTALTATGLAVAEHSRATGRELVAAMAAGYEAAGRLGEAISGSRRGFHASVLVAFGGVVAAGKLLKLTDEQMAHAIALVATTMGGLSISTNSVAREYHAGNAALCAMNAALAASRGYTANPDMLENPRGFLAVFGEGKVDASSLTRDLGREWDIATHLAIKLIPGAHACHPSAEAAVNAATQGNVRVDDVSKIYVAGPQSRTIAGSHVPKDLIEAIHTLPYFVASGVADKAFSWVHASPEKVHSPIVARLIPLVEADPSPSAVHYDWNWGSTVTIVLKSGAKFSSTVDAPRGSAPRGIAWSDVDAKYRALMPQSGLATKRIEESLGVLHRFEQVKSVAELTRLLV